MAWNHKVKVKHLFTRQEDWRAVQDSMVAIAEVLDQDINWMAFDTTKFRSIPAGDDTFGPVDYANRLLNLMYDYADSQRIWIE